MAVVSDFITIVGDAPKTITVTEVDLPFNTGGRRAANDASGHAVVFLTVKGLRNSAPVKVNNDKIGELSPHTDQNGWYVQMIALPGSVLNDGNNVLELEAHPGDNYQVKDVFCFFHQNA